jgi:DNA-binding LacI/PurR family transcriptional regulator
VDRSNGLRTTDLSSKHIGSKQIGFLISNDIFQFVQPGYNQILSGAGEVFHQNGFRLVFHSIGEEETFDSSKDWRHSDLDGYIIVGGIRKHLLERLRQQNAPIVLVDLLLANGGMQSVIIDYAMGIRLAVEHLFELGHKEIGFIGFAESTKYESFWRSLEALGLIYHPRFVQFLNPSDLQPSIIAGFKAMQKMLSSPTLPSAVVTTNDLVAVGSIEALTVAGISVPEELSIVGCDDLGQSINPPLTTIRVDWMNVGRTASRVLMERLDGLGTDVASRQVACAVELVVRGSSGVPGPGR